MPRHDGPAVLPYACLALAMILVGANIPIGKAIVAHVPVFLFSAMRFLVASIILIPIAWRANGFRVSRRGTLGLFSQAFLGSFLFSVFMLYGLRSTSAIAAGIITSATPAAIALLAWLFLRESITRRGLLAVGLCVAGIVAVNLPSASPKSGTPSLVGSALVLAAVWSEAAFAVSSRHLATGVPPLGMAMWVNVFGVFLFAPFALVELRSFPLRTVPPAIWGLMLAYSMMASVLAFLLWYRGISQVAASIAGLFTGLLPISAGPGRLAGLGRALLRLVRGRPDVRPGRPVGREP